MTPTAGPRYEAYLAVLADADPEGLLAAGAPADEYAPEAADLQERTADGQPVTLPMLRQVWQHWFGEHRSVRVRDDAALAALADRLNAASTPPHPGSGGRGDCRRAGRAHPPRHGRPDH